MTSNLFSRVELLFWNFAIRALSQSNIARTALRKTYKVVNGSEWTSMGLLMGLSGVIGLVSGYAFYFLAQGLR
jgi:hypothetical protein